MKSAFWSLLIHLIVGAVALGGIWLVTRDQGALASNLVTQLFAEPTNLEARRGLVAGSSFMSLIFAMSVSWAASLVFHIVTSHFFRPQVAKDGGRMLPLWLGCFAVALGGTWASIWWRIWTGAVNFDFNPSTLVAVIVVTAGAVLMAFWFGTAVPLKNEAKNSVPLGNLVPRPGFMD